MPETQEPFRPYYELDASGDSYEIKSVEQAERITEVLVAALQDQRQRHIFEDVGKNQNAWETFRFEYDQKYREELPGRPFDQSEFLVFAALRMQKAKAIEEFLFQCDTKKAGLDAQKRAVLLEGMFSALVESQQAAATALYRCGENAEIRREIAFLCTAIGATEWKNNIMDNVRKLRAGLEFEGKEKDRVTGLLRGITGHAAAIEIVENMLESDTYSPRVDIDGRHGIDMGASAREPGDNKIDTVVQVKARARMTANEGAELIPVAVNEDERLAYVKSVADKEDIDPEEWKEKERELSLAKLQGGAFWIKNERFDFVDNDRLVALLVVLRSSPYGRSFDSWKDETGKKQPAGFDIHTGLCNNALRQEVLIKKEGVLRELKIMRENGRKITRKKFRKALVV